MTAGRPEAAEAPAAVPGPPFRRPDRPREDESANGAGPAAAASAARAPILITGAPGSPVGPVAEALRRAGLHLGERFGDLGAPPLADLDVVELHDRWGAARTDSRPVGRGGAGTAASSAAAAREDALGYVRARAGGGAPWGWAEDRGSLFLTDWDALLPEARWIFVYVPPAVAAWGAVGPVPSDWPLSDDRPRSPLARAARGLAEWRTRNGDLLAFARARPGRCLLLSSEDDFTPDGAARLADAVGRWGLRCDPADAWETIRRHAWPRGHPRWVGRLARRHRGVERLRRGLDAERRGPGRPPSAPPGRGAGRSVPPPGARVAPERPAIAIVGSDLRSAYSQTFVSALVYDLPARVHYLTRRPDGLEADGDMSVRSGIERAADALAREFGRPSRSRNERALVRFLRRHRIAAVLAQFGPSGVTVATACRRASVPFLVHFRGYDAYRSEVLERWGPRYPEVFATAAAIVCVSRDMEGALVGMGAPPEKITVIPSGADLHRFRPGDPSRTPPSFLGVGRFVDKKGPVFTILAFERVLRECPEATLTLVGDGFLRDACGQLVRGLGLEGRVSLVGARPPWEVAERLRGSRAFVQHSHVTGTGDSEGTPVAVLEAGAAGVPVVATRHKGIPDAVIHGTTGFLVDEGDVAGMAEHMVRLVRDPALAGRMGRAGRLHVAANHSQDRTVARVWEVVEGLIGAAG